MLPHCRPFLNAIMVYALYAAVKIPNYKIEVKGLPNKETYLKAVVQ